MKDLVLLLAISTATIVFRTAHSQHLSEQIKICGSPIQFTLSNQQRWKAHSSVALFSNKDRTYEDLVTDKDKDSLSIFSVSSQQFALKAFEQFYFETNKTYESVAVLLPNTLDEAKEVLRQISKIERALRTAVVWNPTVFIAWPRKCEKNGKSCLWDEVSQMLPQHLPNLLTEAFILQCNSLASHKSWEIYSVYSVGRNGVLHVNKMDDWEDIYDPYARKWNFNGAELRTAIPSTVLKEELDYVTRHNKTKLLSGMAYDVVSFMQAALNFTLADFLFSDERVKQVNGQWVGLGDQLANDLIDFTITKSTFLKTRKDEFTFLIPHYIDWVGAYFRQPPASSIRNIFVQPFHKELWASLVAVWVLIIFSSMVAAKVKRAYEDLDEADEGISKDTVLWAVAFTCQQGWHIDPESITMKIIFFCGSVLGLIIYVAYSAALVSALSTAVVPIGKFEDLVQNNFYFTHETNSETMTSLLNTQVEQVMGGMEASVIKQKMFRRSTDAEAAALVFSSQTAFLSFQDTFYSVAQNDLCKKDKELCEDIYSVKMSTVPYRAGMIMRKMSPYKEFFNVRLIELYEQGLLARFKTHYQWQFGGVCEKSRVKKEVGLEVADMFTAYCIILAGYVLSFLVLFVEFGFHKVTRHSSARDRMEPKGIIPMNAFF